MVHFLSDNKKIKEMSGGSDEYSMKTDLLEHR